MTRESLGIDLGGTKIEGIRMGADGEVLHRHRVPTEQEGGYEHILGRIAQVVGELETTGEGLPLGIGTPGSLSARDGLLKNSNTQCLNGQPIHEDLEKRLGRKIHLENDANCFALAEARLGAGRDASVAFGVILGTGIGGGIILSGRIWSGPQTSRVNGATTKSLQTAPYATAAAADVSSRCSPDPRWPKTTGPPRARSPMPRAFSRPSAMAIPPPRRSSRHGLVISGSPWPM